MVGRLKETSLANALRLTSVALAACLAFTSHSASADAEADPVDYFLQNCALAMAAGEMPGSPVVVDEFDEDQRARLGDLLNIDGARDYRVVTFGPRRMFGWKPDGSECFVGVTGATLETARTSLQHLIAEFDAENWSVIRSFSELQPRFVLGSEADFALACSSIAMALEPSSVIWVHIGHFEIVRPHDSDFGLVQMISRLDDTFDNSSAAASSPCDLREFG